ncbi:MAG: FAD-binding and (Fe-S)-binding domain-containing protein, partial [Phycisphaerae bacterium]
TGGYAAERAARATRTDPVPGVVDTLLPLGDAAHPADRADRIEHALAAIRNEYHDEIVRRFPNVLRSNGGYGLDRLGPPAPRADAIKVLCGSEGTLGVVVGATLDLIPVPRHTGLVVLHFEHVFDACGAAAPILEHEPAAVELVDRMVLDAAHRGAGSAGTPERRTDFLVGDPGALLIVEFFGTTADVVAHHVQRLAERASRLSGCFEAVQVLAPGRQADVWNLRKSGLGLLMSRPGDAQPYAFVEDSAVDPTRLRAYMERFTAVLTREGVDEVAYYAHASVGCIHVRPVLNLKNGRHVERMGRIADAVSDLALAYGGAMTGEHGDGIVRSCFIEKMYGPRIVEALRRVKHVFDPDGILNPGKIVDPMPMTEHLRQGPSLATVRVKTDLDFSAHSGMAGLAAMCSGVGQCRQKLVGTMCPSYMATLDERDTTRARANALRIALSNRGLLDGLDDPHVADVMDLCVSCKACKSECPTGVDMARLKAEYLSHRNLRHGVSRRARFIAGLPGAAAIAARVPRLANLIAGSGPIRAYIERRFGLDRRIPPPALAAASFRSWFKKHLRARDDRHAPRGRVVYFVDTWTNFFCPEVGIAAVTLLEAAGYSVVCPNTVCCGRPAISQGMLGVARHLAETNVRTLARFAREQVPIVGTEPSCILTFVDEIPQLVRYNAAKRIASQASTVETLLRRVLDDDATALRFRNHRETGSGTADRHTSTPRPVHDRDTTPARAALRTSAGAHGVRYHAHCHQKAIVGSDDAVALLRHAFGDRAAEINSGCCGMAGAFGRETEHYDIARAIGEQRLFPAVRQRSGAAIAISGFSCREQIQHHTGVRPRHTVEYLADALARA